MALVVDDPLVAIVEDSSMEACVVTIFPTETARTVVTPILGVVDSVEDATVVASGEEISSREGSASEVVAAGAEVVVSHWKTQHSLPDVGI